MRDDTTYPCSCVSDRTPAFLLRHALSSPPAVFRPWKRKKKNTHVLPPLLFDNLAKGVTPARDYLKRILRNGFGGDMLAAAKRVPTLFWLLPPEVRGRREAFVPSL